MIKEMRCDLFVFNKSKLEFYYKKSNFIILISELSLNRDYLKFSSLDIVKSRPIFHTSQIFLEKEFQV